MQDILNNQVPVLLPAELVAKMEDVKKDREEDRHVPIEELVRGFCELYVQLREMARWELAHRDEIDRSYAECPHDEWKPVVGTTCKGARERETR